MQGIEKLVKIVKVQFNFKSPHIFSVPRVPVSADFQLFRFYDFAFLHTSAIFQLFYFYDLPLHDFLNSPCACSHMSRFRACNGKHFVMRESNVTFTRCN